MKQTLPFLLLLLATIGSYSQSSQLPTQEVSPLGIIETEITGGSLYCRGSAMLPDGSLLATGGFSPDKEDLRMPLFLFRFLPDGSLDSLFGTNGVVLTEVGGRAFGVDAFPLPDGNILVVGRVFAENDYKRDGKRIHLNSRTDILLARYLPDGRLDASFGQAGIATLPVGVCTDTPLAAALLPDGKIMVAGETCPAEEQEYLCGGSTKGFIIRALPNGEFDPTFGQGGKVLIPKDGDANSIEAYSLAVQPDGGVVAAVDINPSPAEWASIGSDDNTTIRIPRLIRLGQDGSYSFLDANNWHVYLDTHNSKRQSRALLPLPGGKTMFLRNTNFDYPMRADGVTESGTAWLLTRYLPDGRIDLTYAQSGNAKLLSPIRSESPYCLAGSQNEAVYIGGAFFLRKIAADGTPDTVFFNNASAAADEMNECHELHLLPDESILASGNFHMTIGRFLPDGRPDMTFGAGIRENEKRRDELAKQNHRWDSVVFIEEADDGPPPPPQEILRPPPGWVPESPGLFPSMSGFSARTLVKHHVPQIKEEVSGVVVTDVCVDQNGKVISVEYNAAKSSITDKSVIREVKRTAKQYEFAPSSSVELDCGEIAFRFVNQ